MHTQDQKKIWLLYKHPEVHRPTTLFCMSAGNKQKRNRVLACCRWTLDWWKMLRQKHSSIAHEKLPVILQAVQHAIAVPQAFMLGG